MTQEPTVRRSLIQLLILLGVIVVVAGGAIVGVTIGISSLLPAPSHSEAATCPYPSGCTTMSIAEVTAYSGYGFPPGSVVIWAYEDTSWFDHSSAMHALVKMPPGSDVPTSDHSVTSISIENTDAHGISVKVSVLRPQG